MRQSKDEIVDPSLPATPVRIHLTFAQSFAEGSVAVPLPSIFIGAEASFGKQDATPCAISSVEPDAVPNMIPT